MVFDQSFDSGNGRFVRRENCETVSNTARFAQGRLAKTRERVFHAFAGVGKTG